jgi:hypothetical protein
MLLDEEMEALAKYLSGDRKDPRVMRGRRTAGTCDLNREQKEQGAITFHLGCFTRGLIAHKYGRIAVANLPLPFIWFYRDYLHFKQVRPITLGHPHVRSIRPPAKAGRRRFFRN